MPNSIEKAMLILREISNNKGTPLKLSDIADKTSINPSTVAHILKTLLDSGYVKKVSHSQGYVLGAELYYLARYGIYKSEFLSTVHLILKYLSKTTKSTACFAILESNKKYIIDRYEFDIHYADANAAIFSDNIYRTVTGRILLANIPEHSALGILDSLGLPETEEWEEVKNEKDFLFELSKIRNYRVYYLKNDPYCSFAAPVFYQNKCVGSIGLWSENSRSNNINSITKQMIRCKNEIEHRLKFIK